MRASTAPSLQNGSQNTYSNPSNRQVNLKIFCYKDTLKIYTFVHDKKFSFPVLVLGVWSIS